MEEGVAALRLPADVESCKLGGHCCWRWLARAALERVLDTPYSHVSLGEAVRTAREQVVEMRSVCDCRKEYVSLMAKNDRDAEQADDMRKKMLVLQEEVEQLQSTREQLARITFERDTLRADNERQLASLRGLEKVITSLQSQHRAVVDGDMVLMRNRVEEAEAKSKRQEALVEEYVRRAAKDSSDLQEAKSEKYRLQKQLEVYTKKRRRNKSGSANRRSPSRGRPDSAGRR